MPESDRFEFHRTGSGWIEFRRPAQYGSGITKNSSITAYCMASRVLFSSPNRIIFPEGMLESRQRRLGAVKVS